MPENTAQPQLVAVIDIGASGIRMEIAEIGAKAEIRRLESLSKPVLLGREVFSSGKIGTAAMQESMEILSNYRRVLDGYGVKRIHAVATSAVREAANRDNFLDKIFIRTGIDAEVIEGAEENRLCLTAAEKALAGKIDLQKANALVIETGAGSTEVIIMTKGKVELSRSLLIGSVRLPQGAVAGKTEPAELQRALKKALRAILEDLSREHPIREVDTFVALGGDMRSIARHLLGAQAAEYSVLGKKEFLEFAKTAAKTAPEELAGQLGISYQEAELVHPALVIHTTFLSETSAENLIIPAASIRDGILLETSQMLSGYKRTGLSRQVINSARSLGRKYRYDEAHALNVTALALKIFDDLASEHGLGPTERLLLEVAGILHDIGIYISPSSHHKHSMYLVDAAELFGLRKAHKDIVANVVRYHRRSLPKPNHVAYISLPRADRTVVSKLAAILRVADALDNGHQQKFKDIRPEREENRYILWVDEAAGDVALERQSLAEKSDMFTDIYGLPVTLRLGAPK